MRFFVAVTDNEWYWHLAGRTPDEVNFWRPGGQTFRAIEPGAPFLFKLHSTLNFIAGGGFFVRSELLPLSLAWDTFGQKNGADSLPDLKKLILAYRSGTERDPKIGCTTARARSRRGTSFWLQEGISDESKARSGSVSIPGESGISAKVRNDRREDSPRAAGRPHQAFRRLGTE